MVGSPLSSFSFHLHSECVYIDCIGSEGSGHHLWENIMVEMAEHSEMVSSNYIENNVVLVELIHSCFMEIYHTTKSKLETAGERAYHDAKKAESGGGFVEYSCECMTTEFQKMVNDVPDGSLVYLRSFSYPFFGAKLTKMPNIVTLINAVQKVPEIDLRFIVMKREWVNCIVWNIRYIFLCLLWTVIYC